jgi:MscS family membrane protein
MIDPTQFWNDLPPELRSTLLRVGLAILALFLIWVLRRLLTAIVVAPLRRLARRTNAQWDDVLLDTIMLPARLLIIAIALAVGAQILLVDSVTSAFVQHIIRTLIIIAVLVALFRAVDALAPSSNRLFRVTGLSITERLLPFVRTAVKLLLIAITVVIVIQEWGYDVSGLVAGLGLGGLAFSLAAKDTVENLFGFTTIVGDQPLVVGEFIKTADVEGIVEHVGIRSTRIRKLDQSLVTVPNSKLASAPILNWSRLSKRWVDLKLVIAYDATRAQIETFLQQVRAMLEVRTQIEQGSVFVRLVSFGEMGMEVMIRCYVMESDWALYSEEKESINLELLRIIEELNLHLAMRSVFVDTSGRTITDIDAR